MRSAEFLIQYILNQKLAKTRFDKFLNEQMIEITEFGKEINSILNKLQETSEAAQATNELVAKKLQDSEND